MIVESQTLPDRIAELAAAVEHGLAYSVSLARGKHRYERQFHDVLLPGLFTSHAIALCLDAVADDLGLCRDCELASHCHVLIEVKHTERYVSCAKLCPILFHDVVRPAWALEDLL